ncbi:MAG: lipopolysaccharide heptosyltransferase II [Burkholderiaceae bacterium]
MVRTLVIAPQWIGDAVMTEPLLRRLHARGERLTVAALPHIAPLFRVMPQVAEVLALTFPRGGLQWPARRQLARQMQGQFDAAYVLPNSLKSALLPWLAGIPQRIGYTGEARVGLLTQRLPNPPKTKRPPMVALYSRLSGEPGIEGDRPHLHADAAQSAATLQAFGLQAGGYVVLVPGAEYGPAKRWPAAHFAALARGLALPVLLLGAAKEMPLCAEIAALAPGTVNLAGQTTLDQVIAVLAAAQHVVSNDSGLMHVAAALGVPQTAIFGSSSPLHTPPLNDRARVLWLKNEAAYQPPLDCAPCFARACPLGHTRCLNDITAASVLQKI